MACAFDVVISVASNAKVSVMERPTETLMASAPLTFVEPAELVLFPSTLWACAFDVAEPVKELLESVLPISMSVSVAP